MTITPAQIDEAERLAKAATEGPWKYAPKDDPIPPSVFQENGWCIAAVMMGDDFDREITEQASKNGPFIAHARTFVPLACETLREQAKMIEHQARCLEVVPLVADLQAKLAAAENRVELINARHGRTITDVTNLRNSLHKEHDRLGPDRGDWKSIYRQAANHCTEILGKDQTREIVDTAALEAAIAPHA